MDRLTLTKKTALISFTTGTFLLILNIPIAMLYTIIVIDYIL